MVSSTCTSCACICIQMAVGRWWTLNEFVVFCVLVLFLLWSAYSHHSLNSHHPQFPLPGSALQFRGSLGWVAGFSLSPSESIHRSAGSVSIVDEAVVDRLQIAGTPVDWRLSPYFLLGPPFCPGCLSRD